MVPDIELAYSARWRVNPHPGMLVAVEGKDGSGQTTLIDNLYGHFIHEQIKLVVRKEPTDGPIGAPIRAALSHRLGLDLLTLQLGFSTDRSDHLHKPGGVIDLLKQGYLYLADRWFWSTLAYAFASGLDIDYFSIIQSKFPLPDLTIYLDVPVAVCMQRMRTERLSLDLFETEDQLLKVEEGYGLLRAKYPDHFTVIDGTRSPDRVLTEAKLAIEDHDKYSRLRILPE